MQLIAHRGASAHAPENTMAAFRLALDMGARALELDVHLTKDRELAVIHDETLKRTGRRAARIGDLLWEEASRADVGAWFDGGGFAGERLPRLNEVLELAKGRAEVNIEIKAGSSVYPGIEEEVVDLVQRRKAWDWAPISSFDHAALYAVRSLDSRARLGYLRGLTPLKTAFREMAELKAESLNLSLRQANARVVKEAHRRGLKVLVYTVNAQKDLDRLARLGVDGVFSNRPELRCP